LIRRVHKTDPLLCAGGHSGSSWGFQTELIRFVEHGLSIAISCNTDSADPGALARRVADHYLAEELGPEEHDEASGPKNDVADGASEPRTLTSEQLAEFSGAFFSPELDATYCFAVVDGGLVVRIEQEPPLAVAPLADDRFVLRFGEQGLSEPRQATLEFERSRTGAITGFALSSGAERGIAFERR
jgi:hypothetical protein